MEALGAAYADDHQRTIAATDLLAPRVVMAFSGNRPHIESPLDSDERETPSHIHRWIEVAMVEGALEYRLLQAENGDDDGSVEPEFVLGSDSAFDVLAEGYGLEESERLGEALAPFMQRLEADGVAASGEPAVIEEIEQIVGAGDLALAPRMDARVDIVAFLEGRLGPSEFILAAVARHGRRQNEVESILESRGERLCIDKP